MPSSTISEEDLAICSLEELVDSAKPEDKLLMTIFAKRYLLSGLEQSDPFDLFPSEYVEEKEPRKDILDMKGKLVSIVYSSLSRNKKTPKELENSLKMDPPKVKEVDFSNCNLLDQDLEAIAEIVRLCRPVVVNLRGNRFHGYDLKTQKEVDDALKNILAVAEVQFVDVTVNPLASTDRRDLFETLDKAQFKKLVWIPQSWLKAGNWKALVSKAEMYQTITQTHEQYYLR